MHGIGCLMIVFACAVAGWREKAALRNRVSAMEDAVYLTENLRVWLCSRRISLPGVLSLVERAFPHRFSGVTDAYERAEEVPFGTFWQACMQAGKFPQDAVDALTETVTAISNGHPPERALELCEAKLQQKKKAAEIQEREKGPLYAAFGLGGGCMLALILF